MKKLLPVLFLITIQCKTIAQVVFCPAGAEWNYAFTEDYPKQGYVHAKIKYVRDSVIGIETFKVLKHDRFCWVNGFNGFLVTLIKQSGDTIFMKNTITNGWQVLYNFAAQPGQSWKNIIYSTTYTTTVDSVRQKVINGFNLKVLYVTCNNSVGYNNNSKTTITERLGCYPYVFNFVYMPFADGNYLTDDLCYSDNAFGTLQFSSKSCNYSNPAGIEDLNSEASSALNTWPNPVRDVLFFEFTNNNLVNPEIKIIDVLGKEVITKTVNNESKQNFDISTFEKGVYFLQIFNKGQLITTNKILKE